MHIPARIKTVFEQSTCIYSREQIEGALDRMAIAIHRELQDKNPVILCVMIGGLVPLGNLLLRLDFPCSLDYVHATRYRGATRGGEIEWVARPQTDLKGRTVLVVDDILDGGVTLKAILEECKRLGAAEVYSAVLVDKVHNRQEDGLQKADFVGLTVENHYIFGFGMDYNEYLRNAPGIYMVAPEHE